MSRRTPVIVPAAGPHWEVWSCAPGAQPEPRGSAETLADAAAGANAPVAALPARWCRTFAVQVPVSDAKVVRQLAYAQIEKRGLAAGSSARTPFACHVHKDRQGMPAVIVDVVVGEGVAQIGADGLAGCLPAGRAFPIPDDRLVVTIEHGRPVLLAADRGSLVHSQVIAAEPDRAERLAGELRIASMTLRQQQLIGPVTGVELRGDFESAVARDLGALLNLPVDIASRPAPDANCVQRSRPDRLLPEAVRHHRRIGRLKPLRWIAAAAVPLLIGFWGYGKYRELTALEARAREMKAQVDSTAGATGAAAEVRAGVRAARERWDALRNALEPRRYPLMQLNALTRCLADTSLVLWRFESKGQELSVVGTAQSAGEAYSYYSTVAEDRELSIFSWSMVQPSISENGQARFEIKGKRK